jgi:hypothetical protein
MTSAILSDVSEGEDDDRDNPKRVDGETDKATQQGDR